MNTKVILASASPRRRELLHQVGLEPEIIPSQIEEIITCEEPEQIVKELSRQKAERVADKLSWMTETAHGDDKSQIVVLGADTVVAVNGKILGKPATKEEAVQMIALLQGRAHQVYTGVTMIFGAEGERLTFAERTDVHVCSMSQEQMERYVMTGEPMDKAGAYGIQGCFAAFILGIEGDYNNVVGLPVGRVCRELMARGWEVWNSQ